MAQKKINIGIIGLGRAGQQMHLPELRKFSDLWHVSAVCDILPERVAEVCQEYPDATPYTDPDVFFQDKNTDVIAIVTPSQLHVTMTEQALAAGRAVFLEKPFALCEAGLAKLEALDAQYPGKLFLRHNRRFEACYNHVAEVIKSGRIGEVFEIKLRRLRHRFRDDWQTRLDCGGGQLNNWGPHLIDQSLQFLDYHVESIWSDFRRIAARGDAEDHIKLLFRGKTGTIVDLEISDAVPCGEPVITVYGTRGMIVSDDEQTLKIRSLPENYEVPETGARPEAPPVTGPCIYATLPDPEWQFAEIPVAPQNAYDMDDIYRYLHNALCGVAPFPVKNAEGFAVVRTSLQIRKSHPEFLSAPDLA